MARRGVRDSSHWPRRRRYYRELQEDLAEQLEETGDQSWTVDTADWRDGGTYHSGGGFTKLLPLVLARRGEEALLSRFAELFHGRPEAEQLWLEQRTDSWELAPHSVRIDIYDLGVAVMNATFSVRLPADLQLSSTSTSCGRRGRGRSRYRSWRG